MLPHTLMVTDRENKYLGALPLHAILLADPDSTVGEHMVEVEGIPTDTPAHEVAKLFKQRDLFSAPVIDENARLLGRITVDDVVDVIKEEADHTLRSMGGVADEDIFTPVLWSARRRVTWLCINLVTATPAALVTLIAVAGFDQLELGLIFGPAMALNLVAAALMGALIPVYLKNMGIDPAVTGGMLLTTVTDAVGFFTFLGPASQLLL